jgi:hypothetical protein
LALGVIGIWRGLVLWDARALLVDLGSTLSPPALALFVFAFVLCGLGLGAAALGLWRRREWGRLVARALVVCYAVIVQVYTWLFVQSGLQWERRWVSLVLATGTIGLAIGTLTWHRSRRWLGLCSSDT